MIGSKYAKNKKNVKKTFTGYPHRECTLKVSNKWEVHLKHLSFPSHWDKDVRTSHVPITMFLINNGAKSTACTWCYGYSCMCLISYGVDSGGRKCMFHQACTDCCTSVNTRPSQRIHVSTLSEGVVKTNCQDACAYITIKQMTSLFHQLHGQNVHASMTAWSVDKQTSLVSF